MKTRRCPTCGQRGVMTNHHILPHRFFDSRPAQEFVFELCYDCHIELEAELIELELAKGRVKLSEMRYVKVVITFILKKIGNKPLVAVELDGIILGLLQATRTYFIRQSQYDEMMKKVTK